MSGEFTREAPDRVWVADVTQHRTDEGWVYLSVVIDAFHRRVVGWAMDKSQARNRPRRTGYSRVRMKTPVGVADCSTICDAGQRS